MKDVLGQEIKIGDCVTHGVRDGNSGAHRIGIVLDITPENKLKVIYSSETKATIHYHNGVVVNIDGLEGNRELENLQEIRKNVLSNV